MKTRLSLQRLAALACILALAVMTACGGQGADTGSTAPAASGGEASAETQAESSAAQGEINLRMSWWGGDARHEATLAALKIFEEKNPGITVTPEYQGYDGYHEKIITQLAGGTAPDVFQFNPEDIMTISANGHPVNLSEHVGGELDLTNVPESNLKDGTFDGQLLTIPLSLQTFCVLFNKTMLDEAGVALPGNDWTWDDYYALVTELQTKLPAGVYASNDLRMVADAPTVYVHQQGGALLTPDGQIKFAEHVGPFFQKFQELMTAGVVPTVEETATGTDALFTEGRVAVTINYNAMVAGLAAEIKDGAEVALAAIPSSQDDKKLGMWVKGDIGLVANSKSAHVAESVRLINAFVNDEDIYQELKLTRGVPPSSKILEMLAADMTPLEKAVVDMQVLAADSKDTPEARFIKGWSTNYKIISDEAQNFAFGNETMEDAIANIVSKFEKELRDAA